MTSIDPETIGPTILVVEDELLIRMNMIDALRQSGAVALEADNASQAWTMLDEQPIHLVFTDNRMPGAVTGATLACRIKAISRKYRWS